MIIKIPKSWVICFVCLLLGFLIGWFGCDLHNTSKNNFNITCPNGDFPDKHGCCPGEVYTDMADLGFNCCPENGDNCFPPIK